MFLILFVDSVFSVVILGHLFHVITICGYKLSSKFGCLFFFVYFNIFTFIFFIFILFGMTPK